ncbi:MAG: hypothetical protein KIT87_03405 [Anaerolineae bacterium]|nr:hypothetical protein [Anaerolineae bacterium]
MAEDKAMEVWDLWFPEAAATGLAFARGRLQATEVLLVHAAPAVLDVQVRSDQGDLLAEGKSLRRTADRPMLRLTRRGREIHREDLWPTQADYGCPVLLPGGEVGILVEWWNAEDESEWRWRIELYNHR